MLWSYVLHWVGKSARHAALLLSKHSLLLLLAEYGLALELLLLHESWVHHAWMLLLLLRKHLRLLWRQVLHRMGSIVASHTWWHAHHWPSLVNGAVGA